MAAGQPEAITDLQQAVRDYQWDEGDPKKSVFNTIPPQFVPITLPTSECPICFRQGLIRSLSRKKKSKSGNWYQQCQRKLHIFMYPPESEESDSTHLSRRASSFHPSSSQPVAPSSPPQPRKGDECAVDGCNHKQQAANCSNRRCLTHCLELARLNQERDGTGQSTCLNGTHANAIKKLLKTLSNPPPILSQKGDKRHLSASAANIMPKKGTQASNPPGRQKPYEMPYGIPVGSDGSDTYRNAPALNRPVQALNVEARLRAMQDEQDEKLRIEIWYWASSPQRLANQAVPMKIYVTQCNPTRRWTLAEDAFLSTLFRSGPISYFEIRRNRWISTLPTLSIYLGSQTRLLIRDDALNEKDCAEMNASMIEFGDHEKGKQPAAGAHSQKIKAESPPPSLQPLKKRQSKSGQPIPVFPPRQSRPSLPDINLIFSDDDDDDSSSSSSEQDNNAHRKSWWLSATAQSVILGIESMDRLRRRINTKTGKTYQREEAFRVVFKSREWKVATWQRQDRVRKVLSAEERDIWVGEKANRPWSDVYKYLEEQGRSWQWNRKKKTGRRQSIKQEDTSRGTERVNNKAKEIEIIDLCTESDNDKSTPKVKPEPKSPTQVPRNPTIPRDDIDLSDATNKPQTPLVVDVTPEPAPAPSIPRTSSDDDFLSRLKDSNPQIADYVDETEVGQYFLRQKRVLLLCKKFGCPFCHKPFPQSPSALLSAEIGDAAMLWEEHLSKTEFFCLFPNPDDSTRDTQELICTLHEEEMDNERLEILGMSCPIRNSECHKPSPMELSPRLQKTIDQFLRCKSTTAFLQYEICSAHALETRIDDALLNNWPILLNDQSIVSRLDELFPELDAFARAPEGYYWEQFVTHRTQGILRGGALGVKDVLIDYSIGYYGEHGLGVVAEWINRRFNFGRHLSHDINVEGTPVLFLMLVLTRHAINLLVSQEVSLKPGSPEMRQLLQESQALGDLINPEDSNLADYTHWHKQFCRRQKELKCPMPLWLQQLEVVSNSMASSSISGT